MLLPKILFCFSEKTNAGFALFAWNYEATYQSVKQKYFTEKYHTINTGSLKTCRKFS